MTEYIGTFRGTFLLNLYLIELGKEESVHGDFSEFLTDEDIISKNFHTTTRKDLLVAINQYMKKVRNELLEDGFIEQLPEEYASWDASSNHKFYRGFGLTNTGKAIAAELEKAKDGINGKIGKK